VYHVLNRAVKPLVLFSSDWDYAAFETLFREAKKKADVRLFDYCLMPNHWHLILCPQRDGELSRFMHWLTVTHVQRSHAFHDTSGNGALYQGRFKAIPVQTDRHFLIVCRYVERNPLRANLVPDAAHWRWSGLWKRRKRRHFGLLDPWPVPQPSDWDRFVNEPHNEQELAALRDAVRRGYPIGDECWRERTARDLHLESAMRRPGRPKKETTPDPFFQKNDSRPLF